MVSSSSELATQLQQAPDEWLAALLRLRPDLSSPPPSSISALTERAATRASVGRAVSTLDRAHLVVLEACLVLAPTSTPELSRMLGAHVDPLLETLHDHALLLGEHHDVAPRVADVIGPTPLGLGPSLSTLELTAAEGWPVTVPALEQVLSKAPPAALRVLEALTWGPPVGTLGTEMPAAARWLLDHQVLYRSASTEVVLPRDIALAARRGRLTRSLTLTPPTSTAPVREAATVDAEVVAAATTILRQLVVLLQSWSEEPRPVLRRGGVAARDITALAELLNSDQAHAGLVVELASMLGLLGQVTTDDATLWAPTREAAFWHEQPASQRWSQLAHAWLTSTRVPWLAGTRTDRGVRRAVLDPDLSRPWAAPLRRACLEAITAWPAGCAPSIEQVHDYLAWQRPRALPPADTVAAVLAEAQMVGLLGAGALADPARQVLDHDGVEPAAQALAALYPEPISDLIVQSDLTGIVPGRPTPELAALLEACADIESRGAALQVRFTSASVARALEHGWSAPDLLAELTEAALGPLPQPLQYLVTDTARRSRQVRISAASAIVRVSEPQLEQLLADPAMAHLGLRQVGPTTLAADASPLQVRDALRNPTTSVVLENAAGQALRVSDARSFAARPFAPSTTPTPAPVDPEKAVARMRAGERRVEELLAQSQVHTADTAEILRAAISRTSTVELVIADASGRTRTRQVRPLALDNGRVRVVDLDHDSELTIAPHRIVSVRPIG
ncbi:MAG: helicase-associated domain-containing protein [Beutenbergiaceae bacterium]